MRFYGVLIGLPRTPLIPYTSNPFPIFTRRLFWDRVFAYDLYPPD
jgi:hypothetical protein